MKIRSGFALMGVLATMFCLMAATPAFAQDHEKHMGPGSDKNMKNMEASMAEGEKAAGLTQEQRDNLKALREEFKVKQQPLREQIRAKHEALRQELDSATPDRAKAEGIAKEIDALQSQATMSRIDEVFKVRGVLTPEQFKKLHEFHEKNMEKMKGKMKDKMGKGKGMHDKDAMEGNEHGDVK